MDSVKQLYYNYIQLYYKFYDQQLHFTLLNQWKTLFWLTNDNDYDYTIICTLLTSLINYVMIIIIITKVRNYNNKVIYTKDFLRKSN